MATCFFVGTARLSEMTFGVLVYRHHPSRYLYRRHRRNSQTTFFFAKAAIEIANDRGVVYFVQLGLFGRTALSSESETEIENETPKEANEIEIQNTLVFYLCLFLCTFRYLFSAEANATATFVSRRILWRRAFRYWRCCS
jgi:hypothetical protein